MKLPNTPPQPPQNKKIKKGTGVWESTYHDVFRKSISTERAIIKHNFIEKLRCHSYDSAAIVSCISVFRYDCLPNCNGLLTCFSSLEKMKKWKKKFKYQLTHQNCIYVKAELITIHCSVENLQTQNCSSQLWSHKFVLHSKFLHFMRKQTASQE